MSVTDRAFIKAYSRDQAESSPPPPHYKPRRSAMAGRSAGPPERLANEPQQPSVAEASDARRAANEASTQPHAPRSEGAAAHSVTSYVPTPHLHFPKLTPTRAPKSRRPLYVPPPKEHAVSDAPVAEKVPLSTLVEAVAVHEKLEPQLEVEQFHWPPACDALIARSAREFDALARQLAADGESDARQRAVAISGCQRGEGRTLVLLCLARRLAALGVQTALVDADFHAPALARRLGLAVNESWLDVLAGRIGPAEAMILSNADGVAILPLAPSHQQAADAARSIHCPVSLTMLRERYEVVLIDAGPVSEPGALQVIKAAGVNAAILVRDARSQSADDDALQSAAEQLHQAGAHVLGVIENFDAAAVASLQSELTATPSVV